MGTMIRADWWSYNAYAAVLRGSDGGWFSDISICMANKKKVATMPMSHWTPLKPHNGYACVVLHCATFCISYDPRMQISTGVHQKLWPMRR